MRPIYLPNEHEAMDFISSFALGYESREVDEYHEGNETFTYSYVNFQGKEELIDEFVAKYPCTEVICSNIVVYRYHHCY